MSFWWASKLFWGYGDTIGAGDDAAHEFVGTASPDCIYLVTPFAFDFDIAFDEPAFEEEFVARRAAVLFKGIYHRILQIVFRNIFVYYLLCWL